MEPHDSINWLAALADEFDCHENRKDGAQVVRCLVNGLSLLRDTLWRRVHQDVEQSLGTDSLYMPVSETKAKQLTIAEIEVYEIAESALAATSFGYVAEHGGWYLQWLARLRSAQLGPEPQVVERCRSYLFSPADDRRLTFVDRLGRVMPESRRAPLVLFRLVPLSIQIATASAFHDRGTAERLRREQATILPAITDCQECRGQVLECVEQCRCCGNPLWKHAWLTAAD
jgi:hypothetical protein